VVEDALRRLGKLTTVAVSCTAVPSPSALPKASAAKGGRLAMQAAAPALQFVAQA